METVHLSAGDRFRIEMPGGGGYADPIFREADRVLGDVLDGYVSLEAARRDYGVVIDPSNLTVNAEETTQPRKQYQTSNKVLGEKER